MSQFPHFPWGHKFKRKRERNPTSAVIRDGNETEPKLAVLSTVDVTVKQMPYAKGIFIANDIYRIGAELAHCQISEKWLQGHLKNEGAEPRTEGPKARAPAWSASGTESLGEKPTWAPDVRLQDRGRANVTCSFSCRWVRAGGSQSLSRAVCPKGDGPWNSYNGGGTWGWCM